jgi:uncharacterized protein YidB (DUF937 family)
MNALFDAILTSIQDPSRNTQQSDLTTLLKALAGGGAEASAVPSNAAEGLAGTIGHFLKPMLKETAQTGGIESVNALLEAIKANATSPEKLEQTLGQSRMEQMVSNAQQQSGLSMDTILRMLPVILPAVIALLQSGTRTAAADAPASAAAPAADPLASLASNPILKSFLDSDGDGDVDMQDLVRMGSKFLK